MALRHSEAVIVILIGACVVLALLTVISIEPSDTQAKSKSGIEVEVRQRAQLAGDLVASLFQTVQQQVMPKKDGREALVEIKADKELRSIPVIVLTTPRDEEGVFRKYDLGVNSFITRPVTFTGLVEVMRNWQRDWFELVELPNGPSQ